MAVKSTAARAPGMPARSGQPAAAAAAQARFRKGLSLYRKGEFARARKHLRQGLKLQPGNYDALHLLGLIALRTGQFAAAVELFDRAVGADPGKPAAWASRGIALQQFGRADEALESYDRALRLEPDNAAAHYNRAVTLHGLARYDEALASYDRVVTLRHDHADAHNGRGVTLKELRRYAEALECFDRAVTLAPDNPLAHCNRGLVLYELGRLDEEVESYTRALRLQPDNADCHWNLSRCRLSMGDFARGWQEYAWRPGMRRENLSDDRIFHRRPLADDLTGRHVVVMQEQGLGDELFFLRYAPMLRARGARVTCLADPRLADMLERAAIVDAVLPADRTPGAFDLRLSVGDLPWLLGADDAAAPFPIPPLAARAAALGERLRAFGPAPYVGITWRAGGAGPGSLFKEVPMERLAAAIRPLGATPVVVQRLPAPGETAALAQAMGRPALDLSALNADLEDMLALMGLLEFYVGVSNTNLHLRAAAGRTSHILVPFPPDFRWMAAGEESPWFRGTRVYRQRPGGDWTAALDGLARDLAGSR